MNFAVVDQAVNVAKKAGHYVSVGMDTTIDIAQDVVDSEKELGEVVASVAESGKTKVRDLHHVMLQYAEMQHSLNQFLSAVEYVKQQAKEGVTGQGLEKLLDEKLAELKSTSPQPNHREHAKYREMEEKIQDLLSAGQESMSTGATPTQIDEDLAMTQADVNVRCPYTGQPMKNPVKNRHCGHNYDKEGIMELIKNRGGRARCPVGGCINDKPVKLPDLEENKELRRFIEKKARQEGKRPKKSGI